MTRRFLITMSWLAIGIGMGWFSAGSAAGQVPPKNAASLRTPDGQPDLQGTWSFATVTPLERPNNLANKEFFTEKEAADYEKETLERNNKDRRDGPAESGDDVLPAPVRPHQPARQNAAVVGNV